MLEIIVNVQLATGDTAVLRADHPMHINEALSYLASIGALKQPPPPPQGDMNPEIPASAPKAAQAEAVEEPVKAEKTKAEKPAKEAKPKTAKAKENKITAQEVTAAVTELANATSIARAREVLQEFGVQRAANLTEDQYEPFIVRAKEVAASQADAETEEESVL